MKVSIITITFNRAHLIGETIQSVLNQTYKDFEYIIIDDGSTDDTETVVKGFNDDRIRYYKYEKSGWRSYLRNEGFRKATGELISVLDSDDIWTTDKLETVTSIFNENPEINFVIHNLSVINEKRVIGSPFSNYPKSFKGTILNDLLDNKILPYPIFTIKQKTFAEIGFLDESLIDGQHDLYLRIASKQEVYYCSKELTLMKKHGQNISSKKDVTHYKDYLSTLEKLKNENSIEPKKYQALNNWILKSMDRNPGLDVLRSLCLFLVVLQHSFLMTDLFFPQFRILWVVSHSALDLFFILSGFLIGGIIEKKYRENNVITLKDIFRFYKRRWFKTVPMYFLVIVICLVLSNLDIYYAKDFSWKFIVFLQNLTSGAFDFLPHTYSLTIEEWFYILFPLSLLGILKLKLKVNPFYMLLILWILVAITFRIIKHLNGVDNWDSEIRKAILTRMDATVYGIVIYFVHLQKKELLKRFRVLLLIIGVSLYLVATLILKRDFSLFYNDVVYYSIIPFFISLILPFFIHLRLPLLFEKVFTTQSLASYSIYLVHLPIIYIAFQYIKPDSPSKSLLMIPALFIFVYALGIIFYKWIEKPIMDLRDK